MLPHCAELEAGRVLAAALLATMLAVALLATMLAAALLAGRVAALLGCAGVALVATMVVVLLGRPWY